MQKYLKHMIIALLAVLLLMLPMAAQAESGTCGADLTWNLNNAGTLTITGNGDMADYTAGTAPWGTGINKVVIEAGVTSIGDYAFYNCSKLATALVSDNVTTIGVAAFKGCTSLTSMQPITTKTLIGDVNDDGVVDFLDAMILLKYAADWNVVINDGNSDVNGDGKLDIQDVLALMQYCAGWDVDRLPTNLSTLLRMLMAYVTPCNHTGRTELTGAIPATMEHDGYTGDLYCLECGELIEAGTVLPKLMELPETGDASQPTLWLTMLLLSGGAILLLRQSRKIRQQ